MRILQIANYRKGVGGISGQVEALQRHLQEDGHHVGIFSTKGSVLDRLIKIITINRITRDYDVIHIHCCSGWGFLPAILGIRSSRKNGKRTILTYHGGGAESFFRKHKRLVRSILLRTNTNIVMSEFLGKVFNQYGIPFTIIPNIIELDDSLYRERTIISPTFICVRSHEPVYDIPCVLLAFKAVKEICSDASLTLVGDGSLYENLMHKASEMGLVDVVFTGRVDNSAIYKYLNKADIMLSASTVDNMPVSLLEAMNAGLLVISSRAGGVPYMIEDGRTGLLFPPGDPPALAEKMLWAIEHQKEALSIVRNAHSEVSKYSWSSIRVKILSIYSA